RKEEATWLENGKDWQECEMRTYRYGRQLFSEDDAQAHIQLDRAGIPKRRLSCQLTQRSCDEFLGLPFNIASYAILTHMFAQQLNMAVGDFVWTGGDTHIYSNHKAQVETQLSRTWRKPPKLVINRKPASIFDYKFEDFTVEGYDPHPAIKAPVAV
ncbi:thymidylate synthase, partial [Cronobacter muytjensii]|uniref:thymidylate synthase n=1 Tax=Cronobacter muytjensii TaxID=413501 RepID=UPI0034D67C84